MMTKCGPHKVALAFNSSAVEVPVWSLFHTRAGLEPRSEGKVWGLGVGALSAAVQICSDSNTDEVMGNSDDDFVMPTNVY